jgi:KDO2-lipid IV(A) lauroyltransferase
MQPSIGRAGAGRPLRQVVLEMLASIPLDRLYVLSTLLYYGCFRLARRRVRLVEAQLARAFPEVDSLRRARIADAFYRQLSDVVVEALRGFVMTADELAERFSITGLESVRARLDGGRSVLLLTAHHRNWEWLLMALSRDLHHPIEALYKPLKNARWDAVLRALRGRFGARLTPAKEVLPAVMASAHRSLAFALVADQVPTTSPHRTWTRFLQQETAFYTGPELLARAARLPVYFVAVHRTSRGRYHARVELLADVTVAPVSEDEITRRYAERLEAQIREDPAGWLWSHNRWKLRRPIYG